MAVSLNGNALITETELETILQISLATDLANTLINQASQLIETICNRKFIAQDYTLEKYDINDLTKYVFLKNYPINTVSEIKDYDSQTDTLLYTYTVNLDYLTYLNEGYIYFYSFLPIGHQKLRITYNAGWAIADIPYDLKVACAEIAGIVYHTKAKSGINSERIGNYSIAYDKQSGISIDGIGLPIPSDIYSVLKIYRKVNI